MSSQIGVFVSLAAVSAVVLVLVTGTTVALGLPFGEAVLIALLVSGSIYLLAFLAGHRIRTIPPQPDEWSNEPPAQTGWYWVKWLGEDDVPEPVWIVRAESGGLFWSYDDDDEPDQLDLARCPEAQWHRTTDVEPNVN